ncbi:MFS transporter [Rhizobium sp. BK376]|uniref:MFS transporter n=1 Tax=Rhizobium sp. BK376 TaxID=2512149 RepID=UPI001046CCDE|nr:MFS transporter [Rhizobium sp. BK376]TCR93373.1 putative MFS family arabinose efflux permease [Rhizobium sp. BK376]
MSGLDEAAPVASTSVFRLFSPELLPATLILAGGVTLYAVESYITATIAPSIVRDIGGLALLSWVTSLFVAAAVLGSIFVAARPRGIGLRNVYVIAAIVFGAGSLICALAPSMPIVLVGRTIQGFSTGALAALAYAFIRFVYPEPLWPKASALYAAIWGISTVIGPTLGGFFSTGSNWRYAFIVLVPLGGLMAIFAPRLLPRVEDDRMKQRAPLAQIAFLLTAVLLVGFAGTAERMDIKSALIAASAIAVIAMFTIEKRSASRLLPAAAMMLREPISRVYLTMFALTLILVSDIYIPYFLQMLHGVTPPISGYLVALVALGWTASAFLGGSLTGRRANAAIVAGCVVEALATVSMAFFLARENTASDVVVLAPVTIGLFLMGFGVGLGWAHLVAKVLRLVKRDEQDKASAAISMLSALASAFGASFSGVIVNSSGLVDPGGIAGNLSAAHWLYILMALPGVISIAASLSLMRASA